MLTSEFLAVDRLATGTVTLGEVTTLEHEAGDDTVEGRASVAKTILASAKFTEIPCRFWHDIVVEFEDDPAGGLTTDADVELERIRISIDSNDDEDRERGYIRKR
jgi:hypothetical protein